MEPINWLHLRALALLALFGVFVMYALLAGSWQSWRGKWRAAQLHQPVHENSDMKGAGF